MFEKTIVIKQFIDGSWVHLVAMPTEDGMTEKQLEDGLEKIKDMIFNSDSVAIALDDESVIFNKKDGPISLRLKKTLIKP